MILLLLGVFVAGFACAFVVSFIVGMMVFSRPKLAAPLAAKIVGASLKSMKNMGSAND